MSLNNQIVDLLTTKPGLSSKEVHDGLQGTSYATVKRTLTKMVQEGLISTSGNRKATTYALSPAYTLLHPVNVEAYFLKEIDERVIKQGFEHRLIKEILSDAPLFTAEESRMLATLQQQFTQNIQQLSADIKAKEMERLAIDLSWKSSQIEGNTYSLLETERLLKDKETAAGKPKDDAVMLLNHKEAINFVLDHKDYVVPLSVRSIEDIHSILAKDLDIDRNLRQRRVGISGTNYRPLDNEHQIREAMEDLCTLVNGKTNVFEKALLCLVLIAYIQPFNDGNKRTSRIVSNAVLLAHDHCPLSFRTVDAVDYKKAVLVFYEQNNISAFKTIFIQQYRFAVNTYF